MKHNSVCAGYIQKIIHQDILIYHHFTRRNPKILKTVNVLFDAMVAEKTWL
ncbi:MAG: hypothetical protein V8Q57_04305 [Blautia sp.]